MAAIWWSDGETIEEAVANGRRDFMEVFRESGRKIPKPGNRGRSMAPAPAQDLYSKLTKRAETEGVSINSLVTAIIAEVIGAKQACS